MAATEHERLFNEICNKLSLLSQKQPPTTNNHELRSSNELEKSLTLTIDVLRKEIHRSQQALDTVESRLDQERERSQRLSGELNLLKQSQMSLENTLTSEREICIDMREALAKQRELNDHYVKELQSERFESDLLKEQVMKDNEVHEELKQKLIESEVTINSLKERLHQQHSRFQNIEDGYINQLETIQVREKNQSQELGNLQKKLSIANKFKSRLKVLIKKQQDEQSKYRLKLDSQIMDKIREIEARDLEIQRLNNLRYQIDKEKEQLTSTLNEEVEKFKALREELKSSNEKLISKDEQISSLDLQITNLKFKESEIAKAYESHLTSIRTREVHLLQENMTIRQTAEQEKLDADEKYQKLNETMQQQISELNSNIQSIKLDKENLQTEIESEKKQHSESRRQLEKSLLNIESLREEIKRQRELYEKNLLLKEADINQLESLKPRLEELQKEKNNLQIKLNESLKNSEKKISYVTHENEKLQKFVNELLHERDQEQQAIEKMAKAAEDKIVELSISNKKLLHENQTLKNQAPTQSALPQDFTDKAWFSQVERLHTDLREMSQALTTLKSENDRLKKRSSTSPNVTTS